MTATSNNAANITDTTIAVIFRPSGDWPITMTLLLLGELGLYDSETSDKSISSTLPLSDDVNADEDAAFPHNTNRK
jgi:hypothetical protein